MIVLISKRFLRVTVKTCFKKTYIGLGVSLFSIGTLSSSFVHESCTLIRSSTFFPKKKTRSTH